MACPVLTARIMLRRALALSSLNSLGPVLYPASSLRACYAMPGTDRAYGGMLPMPVVCDARVYGPNRPPLPAVESPVIQRQRRSNSHRHSPHPERDTANGGDTANGTGDAAFVGGLQPNGGEGASDTAADARDEKGADQAEGEGGGGVVHVGSAHGVSRGGNGVSVVGNGVAEVGKGVSGVGNGVAKEGSDATLNLNPELIERSGISSGVSAQSSVEGGGGQGEAEREREREREREKRSAGMVEEDEREEGEIEEEEAERERES
eukprot:1246757-Rhodomonas_salina.1